MRKVPWVGQASIMGAVAVLALTWVMPNGTLTEFASGITPIYGTQKEDTNSVLSQIYNGVFMGIIPL